MKINSESFEKNPSLQWQGAFIFALEQHMKSVKRAECCACTTSRNPELSNSSLVEHLFSVLTASGLCAHVVCSHAVKTSASGPDESYRDSIFPAHPRFSGLGICTEPFGFGMG